MLQKGRKTRAAGAVGELCPSQIYYFQRQNSAGGSKFGARRKSISGSTTTETHLFLFLLG
jgi:hypothetical protein